MMIRLCKTALVAAACVFFILVALGNVTDYGSNWAFVQHVLAMDTIFPDSTLKWRVITDARLVAAAYWLIICWEVATGFVLLFAVLRMIFLMRDHDRFANVKNAAILGLTMGLLL